MAASDHRADAMSCGDARTKFCPSAYAELWSKRVPGAQVSIIEACGHSPHVEQSDLVADKVGAFLEGVRA